MPQKAVTQRLILYCNAKVGFGIGLDVAGTVASAIPSKGQALVITQLGLSTDSAIYTSITRSRQVLAVDEGAYALTTSGLLNLGSIAERGIPFVGAILGSYQTVSDIKNAHEDFISCINNK